MVFKKTFVFSTCTYTHTFLLTNHCILHLLARVFSWSVQSCVCVHQVMCSHILVTIHAVGKMYFFCWCFG